jgi:DeoD family purine-nucleoside phosphorylase
VRRCARRHEQLEVEQACGAEAALPRLRGLAQCVDRLAWTVVARLRHPAACRLPEVAHRPLLADHHPRAALARRRCERLAPGAGGDDVGADVAERLQPSVRAGDSREATEPAPGDVLEEDALDRLLGAEVEHLVERGRDGCGHGRIVPPGRVAFLRPGVSGRGIAGFAGDACSHPVRVASMPIHLRAETGDYAEAVLLPGDPLRAKYIADTYFENVKQVNAERGLLGFTGTWEGKPVSVQGTGMGCPGATIVFEELIQLGCKRLMRVGTCGGLQPHHALGDLVVALTAVPADSTASHLVDDEPHCPTASWDLIHGAVHAAKELQQPMHVGPIVSSDVFYNADKGQYGRWSSRGVLGVEMEAAALFTVAALGGIGRVQGIHGGCLLTVSDIVVEGEFQRISDEELRAAVDRMTRVALMTVTSGN